MGRYSIVLLDVGETLIGPRDSYGNVYSRVLATLGSELEAGLLDRCLRKTSAELAGEVPSGTDRFSRFAGGETEYWSRFFRKVYRSATGRSAEQRLAERALDLLWEAFGQPAAWRVYDDVVPTLEQLRRDGVRLGVVSNWDSRLPRLLEILDLAKYFETIGVSCREKMEKPNPEFFRRVLERIGGTPRETLHVGDVPELDLAGAKAAGIDAVLLDRAGRLEATSGTLPDLSGVPQVVRSGPTQDPPLLSNSRFLFSIVTPKSE